MKRPVILMGNGLRNNPDLVTYLCGLGIPILTTWMAADLLPEYSPVFCGRPGIYGQRAANVIQQKASLLFCFGARLDEQQVAYRYDRFASNAIKIIHDIDQAELDKYNVRGDDWLDLNWDLKQYDLRYLQLELDATFANSAWLSWCKTLYNHFRPELEGQDNPDFVDPFTFVSRLSDYAQPDDIIIAGAGKAGEILMQSFKVKVGQRVQTLSTNGAMGYDIPLAIGACLGSTDWLETTTERLNPRKITRDIGYKRVLCVTGDGGFMLNIQELEVIRRLHLPIQFFVHSNRGYASIKMMQKIRFDGHIVGADPASGFTIPRLAEIADCFGLTYQRIETLNQQIDFTGQIVELMIDPEYVQVPRVATQMVGGAFTQDAMEDMTPKLTVDELKKIMEA